ncbi:MAG: M67 family metallopeptidase [Acidobacteria bacterium]|nr:M67 family metallopeptidase [Acidobacteriota bacterium]
MSNSQRDAMVAHVIRALPHEGCGLLLGSLDGRVSEVVLSSNVAASARVYEIDPKVLLKSYRTAESRGEEVVGCFHSHTHTDAFPSPTDIAQAPDPTWHYVLISLRAVPPTVRSYRIVDGEVSEETVDITEN